MIRILVVCYFFIALSAYTQESLQIEKFFPADNQIGEWVIKDSIETFFGDDLFYFINGGADIYLEYGFVKVAHANYMNSEEAKIHLEVYEMEDNKAAFGIFTLNSSGNGNKIDIGEGAFLYDYYLHFFKGNYYIRCTTSAEDQLLMEAIKNFGTYTANMIDQKGQKLSLLEAINMQEFQPAEIKYFEGQLGLNNVFNFGHGSVAGFNEGIAAETWEKMVFVFAYKNDYKCREWFASAKGKMQMSKKFFDYVANDDGFTVKDKAGIFFTFKPHGRFFMALKGYNWEEAKPVFDRLISNLNKIEN